MLNITTQTDSLGQRAYNYDGLDHLTQATYPQSSGLTDEHYDYDKVGNRETPGDINAYKYDDNHRLVEASGIALSYDTDGNLISKGDGTNLTYDVLNRLKLYSKAATTASYQYNSANQRISKSIGGVATWYLYNGASIIAEYDAVGDQTKRYDYLPYGYAPAQLKDANGIYEVQVDHLDTPRLLIDQNEKTVWQSNHQAFGATQPDEDVDGDGVSVTFNVRFPGQYFDAESGLYFNWNRYYDPKTGRYLTSDPIGLAGGMNLFAYGYQSPLIMMDYDGLCAQLCWESVSRKREHVRWEVGTWLNSSHNSYFVSE